jgi:hypothetical protein
MAINSVVLAAWAGTVAVSNPAYGVDIYVRFSSPSIKLLIVTATPVWVLCPELVLHTDEIF